MHITALVLCFILMVVAGCCDGRMNGKWETISESLRCEGDIKLEMVRMVGKINGDVEVLHVRTVNYSMIAPRGNNLVVLWDNGVVISKNIGCHWDDGMVIAENMVFPFGCPGKYLKYSKGQIEVFEDNNQK